MTRKRWHLDGDYPHSICALLDCPPAEWNHALSAYWNARSRMSPHARREFDQGMTYSAEWHGYAETMAIYPLGPVTAPIRRPDASLAHVPRPGLGMQFDEWHDMMLGVLAEAMAHPPGTPRRAASGWAEYTLRRAVPEVVERLTPADGRKYGWMMDHVAHAYVRGVLEQFHTDLEARIGPNEWVSLRMAQLMAKFTRSYPKRG